MSCTARNSGWTSFQNSYSHSAIRSRSRCNASSVGPGRKSRRRWDRARSGRDQAIRKQGGPRSGWPGDNDGCGDDLTQHAWSSPHVFGERKAGAQAAQDFATRHCPADRVQMRGVIDCGRERAQPAQPITVHVPEIVETGARLGGLAHRVHIERDELGGATGGTADRVESADPVGSLEKRLLVRGWRGRAAAHLTRGHSSYPSALPARKLRSSDSGTSRAVGSSVIASRGPTQRKSKIPYRCPAVSNQFGCTG